MSPTAATPPRHPAMRLPPRPTRRCTDSRTATCCFWTIFGLFVAALAYLGLLAFTGYVSGLESRAGSGAYLIIGLVGGISAIAIITVRFASRHNHHHRHFPPHHHERG